MGALEFLPDFSDLPVSILSPEELFAVASFTQMALMALVRVIDMKANSTDELVFISFRVSLNF